MQNPLLLDGDIVDRARVRKNRDAAAETRLLEEKARAVIAAVLLVGSDGEAERDAGTALVKIAEEREQDRELAFHVAAAGAVDAPVAHRRAVFGPFGPLDGRRQDDRRRAPLLGEAPHLHRFRLGVVDDELHAALDLIGPVARARY